MKEENLEENKAEPQRMMLQEKTKAFVRVPAVLFSRSLKSS
jgi:hypothetical protein